MYSLLTVSSKVFLIFLLLAGFIYLVLYNYDISLPGRYSAYNVGDWLINNGGGFIRRGLSGNLIIFFSQLLGIRPELGVMFVKVALYSIIYGGMCIVIMRCRSLRIIDCLIIFSPAFLLFPILITNSGGRKELLLIAWMAYYLLRALQGKNPPSIYIITITLFFFMLLHEGLIFFYPLALIALYQMYQQTPDIHKMALIMLPSVAYVAGLVFFTHSPDAEQIRAMAMTIDPVHYNEWMDGAITSLAVSTHAWIHMVREYLSWRSIISVIISVALIILPYALLKKTDPFHNQLLQDKYIISLSLIAQAPLMAITIDWGRWIAIDAAILAYYYLATRLHAPATPENTVNTNQKGHQFLWLILLLSIYNTTWQIRHCCVTTLMPGQLLIPLFRNI